jgi:hypothetical protein
VKPTEDFGWVYATPTVPGKKCRWCGSDNVYVNGVVICAGCDTLKNWPKAPVVEA